MKNRRNNFFEPEPISPPSLASYAWHNSTHCGGVVAFSMMQTSDRELPLSMWYSSSARMKASGVTTFSSACLERMLPSSRVTWNDKIGVESDGLDERSIIAWFETISQHKMTWNMKQSSVNCFLTRNTLRTFLCLNCSRKVTKNRKQISVESL